MSVRLAGSRVTLRPFRQGEFEVVWAEGSRDRGPYERPWPPAARDEVRARCDGSGTWQPRTGLVLAVEADGRLVGDVQARTSTAVFPPGVFEVGIELFAGDRGVGYGTDALVALTRYLFEEEGARRVQLGTHVENAAMRRSAEKSGFAFEGVMRGFWPGTDGTSQDHALYGTTRSDHEGRRWTRTG